jgi:uncharacterized membrane protein
VLAIQTVFSLLLASREPFSVDEYLVRLTALSGSPTAVWHLLKTAPLTVDPPLYHFLIVYWIRIFGPSEFSCRLPSVLAYTAMSGLLYRFVRNYTDVFTGLFVVTLSMVSGSFSFAYYARPYALVLAADALALICWAKLVSDRQKRALALVGLFLGITIAVGSHWFGFLVLAPLAFAEALKTAQERRIDAPVWSTLLAASATAFVYFPLLQGAVKYRALPWKGAVADLSEGFLLVLQPCLFPLILLLLALVTTRFLFGDRAPRVTGSTFRTPVFVCMLVFALMPIAGFLAGKFVTHAYQPRYVVLCALGLLPLMGLAVRDAVRRSMISMALAVLLVTGYAWLSHYRLLSGMLAKGDDSAFANVTVLSENPELPLVPSDADLFLRLEAHAPIAVRNRCVFPTDPSFVRLLGQNTSFLMADALRQWTKLPIDDLSSFLKAHPRFYVIQRASAQGWLIGWLLEDHANIDLRGDYAGNLVYLVQVRP